MLVPAQKAHKAQRAGRQAARAVSGLKAGRDCSVLKQKASGQGSFLGAVRQHAEEEGDIAAM